MSPQFLLKAQGGKKGKKGGKKKGGGKKKISSSRSAAILKHHELSAIASHLVNKPSKTVVCFAFVLFHAKEGRHMHTCVIWARDETTGSRAKKTHSLFPQQQ